MGVKRLLTETVKFSGYAGLSLFQIIWKRMSQKPDNFYNCTYPTLPPHARYLF